ncbi:MAG: type II toxin-antitoxin system RelE/ParE family toxin [Pirellula sp.]|nr:type II toxin-antitoxin system RelE/ParE family toxin [Pirellula sp.]
MDGVFQTPEAVADVRAIADYIAADNLPAAERWLLDLNDLFSLLAHRPFLGERYRSRRHGALRRFTFGNYVVYYQPRGQGVAIVRVLHGARDERKQL